MQIHMQCDNGEIEVFLCPEEESASGSPSNAGSGASSSEEMTDTESEASPMKPLHQMAHPPSPPPRLDLDEESRSSDIGQIRNVLISASEDFGPVGQKLQLQTLDQDNGEFASYLNRPCTVWIIVVIEVLTSSPGLPLCQTSLILASTRVSGNVTLMECVTSPHQ